MSASLWVRAGLRGGASLRFGPIDSREQSCAEGSPRSGGGCAVAALPGSHRPLPSLPPRLLAPSPPGRLSFPSLRPASGSSRGLRRGHPSGGRPEEWPERCRVGVTPCTESPQRSFSRDFAGFRPQEPPESAPPRASGRRRTVSESSCVAPMHAASLTKGYGGNPPSGRSVSPPRTGPFFHARFPALRRTLPRRPPPPAASRQPPSPVPPSPAADPARATPFVMLATSGIGVPL